MGIIGIIGASYCGSTLVSVILDGLPGVAAVGETHCILEKETSNMWNCRTCGNDCEYLTDEFFDRLRKDPSNWWEKFIRQMNMPASRLRRGDAERGIRHIVASEKWFAIYDKLGLPDIALLVWRDPVSWCCSWLMHRALKSKSDVTLGELRPSDEDIRGAVFSWTNFYSNALMWIKSRRLARNVFLHFDKLANDPYRELERLCILLGIEYSSSAINYASMEHHHIRGNGCVTISSAKGRSGYWGEHLRELPYGKISPDFRYEKALSRKQIEMIERDIGVVRIVKELSYAS